MDFCIYRRAGTSVDCVVVANLFRTAGDSIFAEYGREQS